MSGTIGGLGNLVLSLFDNVGSSSSSDNLLSIVYGNGASASAGSNPIAALQSAEANSSQDIAQTAAQPAVARDIATFRSAVASATSPASLLQDQTVLKVLLTANGLGDQVNYPGLARKTLLSNPDEPSSLANTLDDSNWKSTTALYDFANKGLSVLQNPQVINTLANGYAEVTWRNSLDQTTPGLSEALTFRSEASTITSALQILGDATMRKVVTTALDIPEQIAFQDLGAQQQAITSKLDISRFQDPSFVESFTQQYLLAAQQAASSSTGSGTNLDQLAIASQGLVV